MPEQRSLMQAKLGVGDHRELVDLVWPEIDKFKIEFSENKTYSCACTQFKNDIAQLAFHEEPEKLARIKDEVIAESILLAEQNPENPEFIKSAITAVQQKLSKSLSLGDYDEAMLHMNRSNELFNQYMQKSFDKLWVKVYYLEMKTWHALCLFQAKQKELLGEVCTNCIPLSNELRMISDCRLVGSASQLKLQTMALLCDAAASEDDTASEEERRQSRKKQILFILKDPDTPTTALSDYAGWIKLLDVPEDISSTLAEQLALRAGPL